MAEYLAVDYNGLYNSYKQNTDYLEAPIIVEETNNTDNLQNEAQQTQTIALDLLNVASLAQQALDDAIASLASPQDIATAQLALDEAVRLAQEAQVKAEEAQALAEAELNKSLIDKLNFNTLECDINKPTQPLNFITEYTPDAISTFKAEPKTFIKVDEYGNHSTFLATSLAPYDANTNLWNINRLNNVSFDKPLVNGGAFTIMFLNQRPLVNTSYSREGFVTFVTDPLVADKDDIKMKRDAPNNDFHVIAGGARVVFTGILGGKPHVRFHLTIVIVPNEGIYVYKNGIKISPNTATPQIPYDIPARTYNYQNLGGYSTRLNDISLLYGLLGDFRFYQRELSSTEIFEIANGSSRTATNDLIPFNITPYFSEADVYNFNGKNTNQTELLSKISSYGNLHTIGTLTNGSDDRIKSNEVEIENATETLLKLTPKIYDKHPSVRFHEDQEDNDLKNVSHFKESGLIAQEVLKDAFELEHLVVKPKTENDLYGMNYIGLIPYLIKSNQEIYKNILSHRNKINELKQIKNMT